MICYLGPLDETIPGWYFMDEDKDFLGPFKTEWDTELVLMAYLLNYTHNNSFLYLNLKKFLSLRLINKEISL